MHIILGSIARTGHSRFLASNPRDTIIIYCFNIRRCGSAVATCCRNLTASWQKTDAAEASGSRRVRRVQPLAWTTIGAFLPHAGLSDSARICDRERKAANAYVFWICDSARLVAACEYAQRACQACMSVGPELPVGVYGMACGRSQLEDSGYRLLE
jgi:hypothetical protein